jgi:hypothetical protein
MDVLESADQLKLSYTVSCGLGRKQTQYLPDLTWTGEARGAGKRAIVAVFRVQRDPRDSSKRLKKDPIPFTRAAQLPSPGNDFSCRESLLVNLGF